MRVLVVSQYFWPEVFRVNEVVSELSARGHEMTVLTGRPNYPQGEIFEEYARDPAAFSRYAGAQVLRVPLRPRYKGSLNLVRNYLSFIWWGCIAGAWKLRGRQFDAIFVFETSPITAALPAILFKRLKRAPLAMWVLDLWPDTLAAVGVVKSPRLLRWVGHLCGFIYRHCDLVLSQSLSFFPAVTAWSRAPEKNRYFPAWAEGVFDGDPSRVLPDPLVQAQRGRFTVMFAGNIGQAQDFPAVLDAAERLRHRTDIRWLIVGEGRMGDWVQAELVRRQLDNVVMLGRHPAEKMPSFFAAADALLVSLKSEPIFAMTVPGKVQSYLAAGKPVLGMLDGEGARVIRDAEAGLVAPAGDAAALARCVEAMSAMRPEERTRMAERGRACCEQEFNRAKLMDRLEEFFAQMTGARNARMDSSAGDQPSEVS